MMIVHTHRMAGEKRIQLGPTGETVRANIQRLRQAQNLGYTKLARVLEEIGRPIPDLGLRRIEAGDRRVDVDDLMALAVALGVSPVTLLMPSVHTVAPQEAVNATALALPAPAERLWEWLTAQGPLLGTSFFSFAERSWPGWVREKMAGRMTAARKKMLDQLYAGSRDEEVSSGDD
ncbi:hypothetical protein A5621_00880 [Mycobacterium colombiense]|nr:hypothetical protein A5621_00880 [Mycobacterium colombiense]